MFDHHELPDDVEHEGTHEMSGGSRFNDRSTSTSQSPVVVEGNPINPIHRGAPERHATADGADVVSVLPDGAIKAPAQSALDRARKAAEKKKSAPRRHRADAPVRREPRCEN